MVFAQLKQRDNEIQILVAFIRKREVATQDTTQPLFVQPSSTRPPSPYLNSGTKEHGQEMTCCQVLVAENGIIEISKTPKLQKPKSMELDVMELPTNIKPEYGMMDKDKAFELYVELHFILHIDMS